MGAISVRDTITSNLITTLNALESEISSLKDSKKSICQELDKYSYQETMVGKDLQELKLGFNSSLDQLSSLLSGFHTIPSLQESTNSRVLSLSQALTDGYELLFSKIGTIQKLKLQKAVLANECKVIGNQFVEGQKETQALKDCVESSKKFIQNEEAFEYEVRALLLRKEEIEEELEGRSSPKMLLRTSNSRLQDVISLMSEEEALAEIEKIGKRNLYLEEFVKYKENNGLHNIGYALGSKERQEKAMKEYNSMIREKKGRISQLELELEQVKSEISEVQAGMLGKLNSEQRMDMLNEIIQKCRSSIQRGNKVQLKRLLRKKTLLETIEKTVEKARQVE